MRGLPRGHRREAWAGGCFAGKLPEESAVAFGVSEIGCLCAEPGCECKAALVALLGGIALTYSQRLRAGPCASQSCRQRKGSDRVLWLRAVGASD